MSTPVIVITLFLAFIVLRSVRKPEYTSVLPDRAQLTEDDIRKALLAGNKIEAIKVHRAIHSTDLKSAKDAVEEIERQMKASGQLR